ncbi:trichohyalin-like isoform X2 [Artemia franciscana]
MESLHGRIRLSGKSDTDRKKRNELENRSKLVKNTVNNNGDTDVSRDSIGHGHSYLDMQENRRWKRPETLRSRNEVYTKNDELDCSDLSDSVSYKKVTRSSNFTQRVKISSGTPRYKQRPSTSPHIERGKKASRSPALSRFFPLAEPELKDTVYETNDGDFGVKTNENDNKEFSSAYVNGCLSFDLKSCCETQKKTVTLTSDLMDDDKGGFTPSSGMSRDSLNGSTNNHISEDSQQRSCPRLKGFHGRSRGGSLRQLRSMTAQEFIDNSLRSLPGCRSLIALDGEDRRIIELMATRRLTQAESERKAREVRLFWEEDRGNAIYARQLRSEERRQHIAEQRKQEAAENAKRYAIALENYQLFREELISLLKEKEERAERLAQEMKQWKIEKLRERHQRWLLRQEQVQSARSDLEDMESNSRSVVLRKLEERLKQADERKKSLEEEHKRRLLLANQQEESRFQERRKQIEEQIEASLTELKESLKEKQKKVTQHYSHQLGFKEQELSLRRQKQHEKLMRAQEFLEELKNGMEKWRQHVTDIQEITTRRAQQSAAERIARRKKILEEDRNAKELAHKQKMKQLKAEEKGREKAIREQLNAKEKRVSDLVSTRDRMIQQGRQVAITTATIRDHLKQELCLDTFDRRAARVIMENKVTQKSPVVSSPVNESTLFLG